MKRILVVLACAAMGSCSFQSALETYCKNRQERTAGERCEGENSCCSGFQCVSGLCCAQAGTVCSSTAQCCGGLMCSGGKCVGPEEPDAGTDGGDDGGLPDGGSDPGDVDAGDSQLVIITPPRSMTAGSCSPPITVQLQSGGAPMNAPDTIEVFLITGEETASFSADPVCSSVRTSVDITAGKSSVDFYLSATTVSNTLVQIARDPARFEDEQFVSVVAGPPVQLAFTSASQSVTRSACSGIAALEVRDSYGNPSSVTALTSITLTSDSPTTTTFHAADDATCMTPLSIPQLSVPAGGRGAGFRFRDSRVGPRLITATAPGLSPAEQPETIQ